MTTIIYDAKNKLMLGDGRISQGNQITKDDFVKVHNINGIQVGAAGVVTHMLKFFDFFEKNTTAEIFQQETMGLVNIQFPEVPTDDQFEALVAYPSGEVFLFEGNSSIFLGENVSFAIGSGSPYALGALEVGADGKEAMRVATKFDTMSGGEITTVSFEEEPQQITREVAESLSKEELLTIMFGEEETSDIVDSKEIFTNDDKDYDDNLTCIYSWGYNIILCQGKGSQEYLFKIYDIEYDINSDFTPAYFIVVSGFSIEEFRILCDDMDIQYSLSNTREQLSSKIIKEVKSKIVED